MLFNLQKKRAVLPQESYVELFMVVDNNRVMTSSNAKYFLLDFFFFSLTFAYGILQFLLKNSDPAVVQKETVELINYVDGVGQFSHLYLVVSTLL